MVHSIKVPDGVTPGRRPDFPVRSVPRLSMPAKQSAQRLLVIDCGVQVGRRDAHIRVADGVSDFGQGAAASQAHG